MIPAYVIHLESAKERVPFVKQLQNSFICDVEVYKASDGSAWEAREDIKKRHVLPSQTVTRGMLGCAQSHIDILFRTLKGASSEEFERIGGKQVILLEDDCQLLAPTYEIVNWLGGARVTKVDIVLFGANEYAQHAKSREGKAQVELAQISYLLPRLRGWGESLSRQVGGRAAGGAGIGGRGPGETKIETDLSLS